MAKASIDYALCQGCGACEALCPDVFKLEGDKAVVISQDGCGTCDCREAADSCPSGAIIVE